MSIISNTNNPPSSFEKFTSIYGVDVLINPNPNIGGSLGSTDPIFNNRFLDLVQIEVGNLALQNNVSGTNSRLETTLAPGTYWLGVTSFSPSESGCYDIAITLVLA